jgi:hypothetical protein
VSPSDGSLVFELRYDPWEIVRYTSGTVATNYTFTGPLRLMPQGLAMAAGSGLAARRR